MGVENPSCASPCSFLSRLLAPPQFVRSRVSCASMAVGSASAASGRLAVADDSQQVPRPEGAERRHQRPGCRPSPEPRHGRPSQLGGGISQRYFRIWMQHFGTFPLAAAAAVSLMCHHPRRLGRPRRFHVGLVCLVPLLDAHIRDAVRGPTPRVGVDTAPPGLRLARDRTRGERLHVVSSAAKTPESCNPTLSACVAGPRGWRVVGSTVYP